MRSTELLIFGDPRSATALMNRFPSIAIDLPLKVLAGESPDGTTWLSSSGFATVQRAGRSDCGRDTMKARGTLLNSTARAVPFE